LKHAFTNNAGGTIRASVERRAAREVALRVTDDGKGLPAEMDFDRLDSLGLRLVRTLARQLDGRIEIGRDNGTQITIVFPEPEKLKT
jgi:two-component sensor histidine kinase